LHKWDRVGFHALAKRTEFGHTGPMTAPGESAPEPASGGAQFHTTHWSLVLAARLQESPEATEALEKLCRAYWYPLYAYIRRRGHDIHEAEDLTQEFFTRLLEKNYLREVTREGGRFRSYLLTTLKHFLANEWDRAKAQKRGGGNIHFSLDNKEAETRYEFELKDDTTPESLFERRWALTLLDHVLSRLREDYAEAAKLEIFERLQVFLSGDKRLIPYTEVAASLGLSEGSVKVAVHRLRKRYGELLRQEIAQTVATPEEVADEIRHLIAVTSR